MRVAADVADRDGWSKLTLSKVAKEVNRHVTSLYAHVDGLDALRREVALLALAELADEVWKAALGRSRDEALVAIAGVERAYARKHPGRNTAMATYARSDDEELRARGLRLPSRSGRPSAPSAWMRTRSPSPTVCSARRCGGSSWRRSPRPFRSTIWTRPMSS